MSKSIKSRIYLDVETSNHYGFNYQNDAEKRIIDVENLRNHLIQRNRLDEASREALEPLSGTIILTGAGYGWWALNQSS